MCASRSYSIGNARVNKAKWPIGVYFLTLLLFFLQITSCEDRLSEPAVQEANPASVHCLKGKGNRLDMRKDKDGTYGVCIFPDGSECEEWTYFRGECKPAGYPDKK